MPDNKLSDIQRDAGYIVKKTAGNGFEVNSVENWDIGALNSCYKIAVKNSTAKFFLKIENEDIIPSTRRGQIEREVKSIELMNSVGIQCPVLLQYDCSRKDIGRKYMIQEFIDHDLLWEIQDSLTQEENDYIQVQILDILDSLKNTSKTLRSY